MGKRCPNKNFPNGFPKLQKFLTTRSPNSLTISGPLEMLLVRTWTCKYKGRSSQFLPTTFLRYKISNKIPNHKIPKFPNNFQATKISLVGT